MLRLVDAPRCPYCARVRIMLAEKGIEHDPVVIDLADRPAWLYELNPAGRVPVLEEDGWALPESVVINEFLEERDPGAAAPPGRSRPRGRRPGCSSFVTTTSRARTTRCDAGRRRGGRVRRSARHPSTRCSAGCRT